MVDFLYLFKDINFQKGFLLVACIILIMFILNVAYKLSKEGDGGQVNPIVAPCPDFWDLSGTYCINTNGQNVGFGGVGEYSIWTTEPICGQGVGNVDPYFSSTPIKCNNSNLRTIPIGTMYYRGNETKILVGGKIKKDGSTEKIKKKRSKASRTIWANKYGFAWDGLNTRW